MVEKEPSHFPKLVRVLGVEDNQVDQRILDSMLTDPEDHTSFFRIAGSLAEALEYLSKYEFDVVVLDLNLPDSKGTDTLKTINNRCPDVAIVVNTGAYEDELGINAIGQGAQEFLVKGKYTPYELIRALHYAIERKRLQVELRKTYEQLNDIRTQLIHAEKLKVIGGLASGVAHEVKNPLATILYGVTYLKENLPAKELNYHKILDTIREATHKANNIITDLLDFSSLNQMNKKFEDLTNVVTKSMSLVQHELERTHTRLRKDLDLNLPLVEIDRNRIEQVLVNLLLNAIQSSGDGQEITLRTSSVVLSEENPDYAQLLEQGLQRGQSIVQVDIIDTGTGIEAESLDKVFDPFFTTARDNGGVGLGLTVCKNIIQLHDGAILIRNNPDRGATASIFFKHLD